MEGLNSVALARLREAGLASEEWTVLMFGDGPWRGAPCGCDFPDCTGAHHQPGEECQCLSRHLDDWQQEVAAVEVWRLHQEAGLSEGDGVHERADRAAAEWAQRYYPDAAEVSLDVKVQGLQGIVLAYPTRGNSPASAVPREAGGFWRMAWHAYGGRAVLPEQVEA